MAQSRASVGESRWEEWVLFLAIALLAAIGVSAIWGGSIRRWVDSSSGERSESPGQEQPIGPAGSRL